MEKELYAVLAAKCNELRCTPIAIGGVADHVHVLAELRPIVPVSVLVGELKGSSSHMLNRKFFQGGFVGRARMVRSRYARAMRQPSRSISAIKNNTTR